MSNIPHVVSLMLVLLHVLSKAALVAANNRKYLGTYYRNTDAVQTISKFISAHLPCTAPRAESCKTVKRYCHSGGAAADRAGLRMADQRVSESSTSSRCFNGLDDNNNDFFGLIGQIVNIIFNGSRVLHERFNS